MNGQQLCWIGKDNKIKALVGNKLSSFIRITLFSFSHIIVVLKLILENINLMGLAPYGEPKYVEIIKNNLIDIKEDGTFRLDMSFSNIIEDLE